MSTTYFSFYDSREAIQLARTTQVDEKYREYFNVHRGRFAYILRTINAMNLTGRCLDVAGVELTRQLIETNTALSAELTSRVDLEIDSWSDSYRNKYDVALLSEVIEHFNADPAHALYHINKSLRMGGASYCHYSEHRKSIRHLFYITWGIPVCNA